MIWRDGQLIPYGEATVHVLSHAAHRGSEVFDVLRVEQTSRGACAVGLREHVVRFIRSMELMGMQHQATAERLSAVVAEVVAANGNTGTIKLVASWVEEANGVLPATTRPTIFVASVPIDPESDRSQPLTPIKVQSAPGPKIPNSVLPPSLKVAASYTPGIRHKLKAVEEGFDEILFKTASGDLAESSSLSCIVVSGGRLIAPPLDTVLDGITRRLLFDIAESENIVIDVRPVVWTEVQQADEVFLSSTNKVVMPVCQLDSQRFEAPGPISQQLTALSNAVLADEHPLSKRWLTPLAG